MIVIGIPRNLPGRKALVNAFLNDLEEIGYVPYSEWTREDIINHGRNIGFTSLKGKLRFLFAPFKFHTETAEKFDFTLPQDYEKALTELRPFQPKVGEQVWYVRAIGDVASFIMEANPPRYIIQKLINNFNVYPSKEEAEAAAREELVFRWERRKGYGGSH